MKRIIKRLFFIFLIFIVCIALLIGYIVKNTNENSKVIEYKVANLSKENCKYFLNEENRTINIEEVKLTDDEIDIPAEINGYKVDKIDVNSFSDCYNLEVIKISKDISDYIVEIPDFELRPDLEEDDFVIYTTTREYSEAYVGYLALSDEEKENVGVIPTKFSVPVSKLYTEEMEAKYSVSEINSEEIPDEYDLRDYIDVEVENQKGYGICYAYASLSSVETNLAMLKNEYLDFSEIHAAVLTTGDGGQLFTETTAYYSNKLGPVYEDSMSMAEIYGNTSNSNYSYINTYLSGGSLTSSTLTQIQNYAKEISPVKYVTDTTSFPAITYSMKTNSAQAETVETIRNTIKTHIMTYGSVATCMASSGITEDNGNGDAVSYTITASTIDHAVSIIGWDDNYPKENFPSSNRPAHDGAYLIMNSWGEAWGEQGCFWISYDDKWVEVITVGVNSVENVESNVEITSITVVNSETEDVIQANNIEKGLNVNVTLEVEIEELIAENSLSVSIKKGTTSYDSAITSSSISDIVDNKATVSLSINTTNLSAGQNIIIVNYGDDKAEAVLSIIADYETSENADGTINITKYIGSNESVIVPSYYYGKQVYKIADSAFEEAAVTEVIISDGIKEIGVEAFYGCTSLTRIVIGNSVETIGTQAFSNCQILESITLPQSLTALPDALFLACYKLEDFTIPSSVKTIGKNTFQGCNGLKNFVIPEGVETIDNLAFVNATGLESIEIGSTVTSLGGNVFQGCTGLKSIEFKGENTGMGTYTFYNCTSLVSVTFPSKLTALDEGVFAYCSGLKSVTLPDTLVSIGRAAFAYCTGLNTITLPESLQTVSEYAFRDCSSLVNIEIPKNVTTMEQRGFYNCIALKTVVFKGKTTTLGIYMFQSCSSLESVMLPENLVALNEGLFANCSSLKKADIPKTVTSIARCVYYGCTVFPGTTIPRGVTSLAEGVFYQCTGLIKVTMYKEVTSIGSAMFTGSTNLVIYCEANSKAYTYAVNNDYGYHILENYNITYNGNSELEVTNLPSTQVKVEEEDIILSSIIPELDNYEFNGWSINKDAEIGEYSAGGTFNVDANTELFAIWKLSQEVIDIENLENNFEIINEDDKSYIEGIEAGLSLQDILDSYPSAKFYKNGVEITDLTGKISTGIQIKIGDYTYTVVICGDITGDGEIDDLDLLMLARYMVGCESETDFVIDEYLRATDVYDDDELASDKDLLKLARNLLD